MFRSYRKTLLNYKVISLYVQKKTFLTNDYKCTEAWNAFNSTPVFTKININDFYNVLDQTYMSKGVISAIDVDIFANAIKDSLHLEELKDLLHKLRLSAETSNMLESTQHATVRNFLELGYVDELIEILHDPLNFGVFLDDYSANILLDKLLSTSNYELAAKVASLIMLQEDYSNDITCALCKFACYKYITGYTPPEPAPPENKPKKIEEIKIRVKFLRNPYFDDHFDIKDTITLSGKTLAWMSESSKDHLNNSLQIIGWLIYKKYDKLQNLCDTLSKEKSSKIYIEVLELLQKEIENVVAEMKPTLENCYNVLSKLEVIEAPLDESLKNNIENAINRTQNNDIAQQQKMLKSWAQLREEKLDEQTKRLDRARRIQLIEQQQTEMKEQEQKLWFFENEDQIDLEIEDKEKLVDKSAVKNKASAISDEDYIPPEIVPKKK